MDPVTGAGRENLTGNPPGHPTRNGMKIPRATIRLLTMKGETVTIHLRQGIRDPITRPAAVPIVFNHHRKTGLPRSPAARAEGIIRLHPPTADRTRIVAAPDRSPPDNSLRPRADRVSLPDQRSGPWGAT